MKNRDLAAVAVAAVVCGVGYTAYLVRGQTNFCPQPSAATVATLFAPCQAFDTAMGRSVSKQEAVRMGLLMPNEKITPPATQLAASPDEHATVGVAPTRRR